MRARTWVIFILINVIVSTAVVLTVLFIWDRVHTSATPTTTPTLAVTEEAASTPSTLPVASPTPPGPLLYTVREGDTLGVIAQAYGVSIEDLMTANGLTDPNLLYVGQTLVIPVGVPPLTPRGGGGEEGETAEAPPEPSPTSVSRPILLPTPTPSGPPLVEIGQVLGSGDVTAEMVIVRNRGGAVSLEGWTLSDAEGNTFVFPALTLFTDAEVRVHSAAGSPTPRDLYWGRVAPAWGGGELITLRDAAGNVVDTYIVP